MEGLFPLRVELLRLMTLFQFLFLYVLQNSFPADTISLECEEGLKQILRRFIWRVNKAVGKSGRIILRYVIEILFIDRCRFV